MSIFPLFSSLKVFFLLVFLGGMQLHSFSQNLKEDIKLINESYLEASSLQQEMHVQLFSSHDAKQAIESYTAFIQRKGESFYMRRAQTESLSNARMSLLIDHRSKSILLQKPVEMHMPGLGEMNLDSALSICEKTVYEQKSAERGVYHFHMKDYLYESLSIEFDLQTHFLRKFSFYAADPENDFRMEISFSNIKRNLAFPKNTFSETKFLSQKSGKYSPTSSFATYQILNYLSK
ncbi:MAG: hypothetical protein AAF696_03870 [Bacteroidota bacterium]